MIQSWLDSLLIHGETAKYCDFNTTNGLAYKEWYEKSIY